MQRVFPSFIILICNLLFSCSIFASYADMDAEMEEVYKRGILSSPLIKKIHADGVERRAMEEGLLRELTRSIGGTCERQVIDSVDLHARVRAALEADLAYFNRLRDGMKNLPVGEGGVSFQLKTNKMHLALEMAAGFDIAFLEKCLAGGAMPEGYAIEAPEINIFGDPRHIYASGRGIALKVFLMRAYSIVQGIDSIEKMSFKFVGGSPFVHLSPLHLAGVTSTTEEGGNFWCFCPSDGIYKLGIVHNGYVFGGQRRADLGADGALKFTAGFPAHWKGGPEDCSSFVARYIGTDPANAFSTAHQLCHYLKNTTEVSSLYTSPLLHKWLEKSVEAWGGDEIYRSALEERLRPLYDVRPDVIQPGWVHAERGFKPMDDTQYTPMGKGGHTSFFVGSIGGVGPDAKAITLGANRDIESGEAFGVPHEGGSDGMYVLDMRPLSTVYYPGSAHPRRLVHYAELISRD